MYLTVLKTIKEKRLLIDSLKIRIWQMIGQTFRHGDEFHSLIIEGIIEGIRPKERPKTKYISQIIKDAGITSYRVLKTMANDREKWRRHIVNTFDKNQS